LAQSPAVNEAWSQGRALSLHGWIYSIEDGLLKDLGLSLHDQAGVSALG
jgi:carbonic anhydrase